MSDNDQILLHEYIVQIQFLNTEIKNIESKIICETSKNGSVKILMSMTEIDYFSVLFCNDEIFSQKLEIRHVSVTPEKQCHGLDCVHQYTNQEILFTWGE
ncbi:MAG: hypothetical protein WA667_06840 [Candidatus Nitrosopolaris sp.]